MGWDGVIISDYEADLVKKKLMLQACLILYSSLTSNTKIEEEGEGLSATILNLESLLADMENFNVAKREPVKAGDDLEAEVDDLTEKLKTAMASGVKIESSLGSCSRCGEEIGDKPVLVGTETFHEGCFVCSVCIVRLTGRYYQVDGEYFCQQHREVNLPRCVGCEQPLTAEFLTITGQLLPHLTHSSHLISRPYLPPGMLPL